MVNNLTISKSNTSVTLHATDIAENHTNKIFPITGATTKENQASGPSDTKLVDLLRIIHQFVIKCYIAGTDSKTAKEVKDDLISIFEGAGATGGVASLVYDGDTFNGFIEKINLVEKSADGSHDSEKDYGRYEVALTFIVGVGI